MPCAVRAAGRAHPTPFADKAFRLLAKHGRFDNLAAAAAAELLVAAARTTAAASCADARIFPSAAGAAALAASATGAGGSAASALGLLLMSPQAGGLLPVLVGSAVVVPLAARLGVAVREALATLGITRVEAAGHQQRGLRFAARFDPAPGCAGACTGVGV